MVYILNYSKMASCSGSLLCLPVTRDLIKEPIVMNCGMVSSLDSAHVLRASSSQLHHHKFILEMFASISLFFLCVYIVVSNCSH